MLRSMKPVALPSQGGRRSTRRLPPWLMWLGAGVLAGGIGVVVVQQRYLPPRLSAEESAALRAALHNATDQRDSLQRSLESTSQRLDAALADRHALTDSLAAAKQTSQRLREQLALIVDTLPPDPRGGAVQQRAGHFTQQAGQLHYELVLSSRNRDRQEPWQGTVQFTVGGASRGGVAGAAHLPPVTVSLEPFAVLRGTLPLPDGFKAQQVTVNVVDKPANRLAGMRVWKME